MPRLSSVSGQLIETKSASRISVARSTFSTPWLLSSPRPARTGRRRARASRTGRGTARASRLPTLPRPTMPTVWPNRSWPMKSVAVEDLVAARSPGRPRRCASRGSSIMASTCSATASLLPPAWLRHSTPGLGAGLQVDGVVAGAVGRDDQQALRAAQQVRPGVILLGELVARRAGLVGMRAREHRRRLIVRALVFQDVEADVGTLADDLGE